MNAVSVRQQVSLIHVLDLPIPPSPTTPQALAVDFTRYPSSRRVSHSRGSRLHLSPAGSPTLTGRIEFVILRMDRSPPAAPHPASRRRSSSWLQAGERMPEEDLHLSDQTRFQAHVGPGGNVWDIGVVAQANHGRALRGRQHSGSQIRSVGLRLTADAFCSRMPDFPEG